MTSERPIRVLIADDDADIVRLYDRYLRRAAQTETRSRHEALRSELFDDASTTETKEREILTTTCGQGDEAVRLASEAADRGEPYDVVILDIRMPPGISGVDAASLIREFDKDVPIILVTGFTDIRKTDIFATVPPPDKLRYLTKPVSMFDLALTVNEVAAI
jgi:CheY-like chemotaxis protein